jgi:hypothetical protein
LKQRGGSDDPAFFLSSYFWLMVVFSCGDTKTSAVFSSTGVIFTVVNIRLRRLNTRCRSTWGMSWPASRAVWIPSANS